MSQSITNGESLEELKTSIAALRGQGSRRQFPESIRTKVLALRQSGWSVKRLASELGLAGSQIYDWAKKDKGTAPAVVQVDPAMSAALSPAHGSAAPGALQLRWGPLCISIDVVGA